MSTRIELASTYELLNNLDKAEDALRQASRTAGGAPPLLLEAAKLLRRKGELEPALGELDKINVESLPARLHRPYYFELGQLQDRLDNGEAAYAAFKTGNDLGARDVRRKRLDADRYLANIDKIRASLVVGQQLPSDNRGEGLCFLHGFTRSGTTLLDMMLEVNPAVVVLEEVPLFERIIDDLAAREDYPSGMQSMNETLLDSLVESYQSGLSSAGHEAPLIVDKMPMRFVHSALIRAMFPKAKILFSLRHPCDVVLSNFMQQYPSTSDYLINFDSLERAATVYDRTMSLWHELEQALGLQVTYIKYEDLIDDAESCLNTVCTNLGLELLPEMLDTLARNTQRERVITPSYQQVSEPLFTRASGRWLRYRAHFEGVLPVLEKHCEKFDYVL